MLKKRLTAGLTLTAVLVFILTGWSYEQESPEYIQAPVINVQLPISLDFTINPFETDGREQIYSDRYVVRNLSEADIVFNIVSADVTFSNYAEFEPIPYPFDESLRTDYKAIYLSMDFDGHGLPPITLTDPYAPRDISVPLESYDGYNDESSSLAFSFSGNVNPDPAVEWYWGDVRVSLVYSLEMPYTEEPMPEFEQPYAEEGLGEELPWEDYPPEDDYYYEDGEDYPPEDDYSEDGEDYPPEDDYNEDGEDNPSEGDGEGNGGEDNPSEEDGDYHEDGEDNPSEEDGEGSSSEDNLPEGDGEGNGGEDNPPEGNGEGNGGENGYEPESNETSEDVDTQHADDAD